MSIKKQLQTIGFDSTKLFTGYCDAHSQTQRALFRQDYVAIMVRLAGSPKSWPKPREIEKGDIKFYSLHEEMSELVTRYKSITQQLQEAKSFKELLEVAMMILTTTHEPLSMVSGPISTGGKGSSEANILAMQEYIEELHQSGENIFDQTPFEDAMGRLKNREVIYDYELLNDFYLPIFESGYIKKMFFMEDWESSTGANWEHEQMIRLRIEKMYQKVNVQS